MKRVTFIEYQAIFTQTVVIINSDIYRQYYKFVKTIKRIDYIKTCFLFNCESSNHVFNLGMQVESLVLLGVHNYLVN